MEYFIKDNFYFDIDSYNQLRITGPENHLLFGATFPTNTKVSIKKYSLVKGNLKIYVELNASEIEISTPLVCDIRTLRLYTESASPRLSYEHLVKNEISKVLPKKVRMSSTNLYNKIHFFNEYEEDGVIKFYGSQLIAKKPVLLSFENNILRISSDKKIEFIIQTYTNIRIADKLVKKPFKREQPIPESVLKPIIINLYQESKKHIKFLLKTRKTSSFEYGTIFPRDWIESADLGHYDFSLSTIDYMYEQSMEFISEEGEGWHENVIGETKYEINDKILNIDRRMIDIEPRYILGLRSVSKRFLTSENNHQRLLAVSKFILDNARKYPLMTFKKSIGSESDYLKIGNWRDSEEAFPRHKAPLAPYDVNCVFYPQSLRVIREYADYFEIEDKDELDRLISKWDKQKEKFRLYHSDDLIGYSLALHGKKNIPLSTSHLDESYDLFYGQPSLEEVISFARKIVDPEFFYTPVGPVLVATDDDEFTTGNYHGKVIWPKQAAFSVAGLTKQYHRGISEGWAEPVLHTVRTAIIRTCEGSFKGWEDLNAVPELYYYDEKTNRARLYTDQESYEGQMSLIQLWSAVGCRRIIHDYIDILNLTQFNF